MLLPLLETATNIPFPYATAFRPVAIGDVRAVQFLPSGEVMIVFVAVSLATATKSPFPYATPSHTNEALGVALFHAIPFEKREPAIVRFPTESTLNFETPPTWRSNKLPPNVDVAFTAN